ncbi:GIY-YIG nuclease family protein [Rhodothermus marinus]|uniref:GIY-YIG nuclease family protein n=1 Tax=Rhodothermus marinus TaxID=29549 RepID=UPI0037C8569F
MPFFTYVLQSKTTGRLYIGHTQNLQRRLHEHNAGQTRSTRNRGPWQLIFARSFNTRAEAVRFERQLKRLKNPQRVLEFLRER